MSGSAQGHEEIGNQTPSGAEEGARLLLGEESWGLVWGPLTAQEGDSSISESMEDLEEPDSNS